MINETIVAQATPTGKGGVGIIRLSGPNSLPIAKQITGLTELTPRYAHFANFYQDQELIDQGIALYFAGPNSFTGEDVVELQAHGGPVIMQWLVEVAVSLGARIAKPGEFSERAFLNNKIDLAQAEAIADLINTSSRQAARLATQSLQGAFSKQVNKLLSQIINLRMYVEAAIDFPEEEIDFLADSAITDQLADIITTCNEVLTQARTGQLLQQGMQVVIAGQPNAGKSSLLNALAGKDRAIVTDIAGTTRDILTEDIVIEGVPVHIIDTAGLRSTSDVVEAEGVKRAQQAIESSNRVLLIIEQANWHKREQIWHELIANIADNLDVTVIINKIDLMTNQHNIDLTWQPVGLSAPLQVIPLSAKTGQGLNKLKEHLLNVVGFDRTNEGQFIARQRHVNALERAHSLVVTGSKQLSCHQAGELLAEDLKQAQLALSEITGEFTSDDLLGKIFSSFCIGK